jgi:ketosteroid isomerase-like protein
MSDPQDNVELSRAATEHFRRGDLEAFLATLHPEVEIFSTPDLPNPGSFTGREGWIEWTSHWFDAWEDFEVEIEEYEPVGQHHVLMRARQRAKGVGSGVPVEMQVVYLSEYRDGLVVRFHLYATREKALEVAQEGEARAAGVEGEGAA